jgi:LysM repeat protein
VVIRQNRAVPILLVLTFAFILYLAGCFGSEEPTTATEETPTAVVATPTPAPVVSEDVVADPREEDFYHTIEEGDRLGSIASKYGVTTDVIIRANPDLNPNVLIVGQRLLVPGATTNNESLANTGPDDRDVGVESDYAVQPGDTMGAIAEEWTVSLEALLEANPDVDPSNLQVNQLLVIPPFGTGLDPAEIEARSTPVPVEREPGEPLTHIVAAGDFIAAIAEVYGVTINEIVEANGLPNGGNEIQVGQALLIPPPSDDEG